MMQEKSELHRVNPENEMEFANLLVIAHTHPLGLTSEQLDRVQQLIDAAVPVSK